MSVRIVQLSDLHLYRDPDSLLAGVPTWATFRAVLDLVSRQQDDFDYLILTGDLAQDEALETYKMLRETLGNAWMTPEWFRFGASSLANDVLMQIVKQQTGVYQSADYFSKD